MKIIDERNNELKDKYKHKAGDVIEVPSGGMYMVCQGDSGFFFINLRTGLKVSGNCYKSLSAMTQCCPNDEKLNVTLVIE